MVNSLTVEFPPKWNDESRSAAASLFKALYHMQDLSDLRIRLPVDNTDPLQEQLNVVLRSVAFRHSTRNTNTILTKLLRGKHFNQLHTLFTNHYLDFSGILNNQLNLQLLGIYSFGGNKSLLESLVHLHPPDSLSTLPLIFGMDQDTYFPVFDTLIIFPTLYSNPITICQPIALSFDQDISYFFDLDREDVSKAYVYLRDFSDVAYIHNLVEDMGLSFPNVEGLTFRVKHPSQIVSLPSLCGTRTNFQIRAGSEAQNLQKSLPTSPG
jgi:hypothetical protein